MEASCRSCHQFFGHLDGFCSKCYKDQVAAVTAQAAPVPVVETPVEEKKSAMPELPKAVPGRCVECSRRLGPVSFTCKCEGAFCAKHRLPEQHRCAFDHQAVGRDQLAKANPKVQSDKFDRL